MHVVSIYSMSRTALFMSAASSFCTLRTLPVQSYRNHVAMWWYLSLCQSVPCPLAVIDCWKSLVRGGDGYRIRRDWRSVVIGLMIETVIVVPPVREELDRPCFGVVSGLHKGKVTGLKFHISLG